MKKIYTLILLAFTLIVNSQTIQHINNGESGLSTRNKLNNIIDKVNSFNNTVKSNTLTTNYIPKAIGSDSLGNSIIVDDGSTVSFNSIIDGATTGTNNTEFKTSTGSTRTAFYGATGLETIIDFYTNNVKNSFISELSGYIKYYVKNRFSIIDYTANKSKLFVDMSTGYTGIGDDYTTPNERLEISNGKVRINDLTASKLVGTDASKNLSNIEIGSGLSLTSGTLSATSSGSTTTISSGTNITVSGSAPNYTVSVDAAMTGSVSSNTSAISTLSTNVGTNTSAISTLSTNVASNTSAISTLSTNVGTNTSAISTLSTSVANNTSSITTLQSSKQNTLVAGSNITLSTNTISLSSSPTIISPTFSTSTTYTYATANTVPIFNGSNNLVSSSTTTTQLSYLDATSSIQTQLDAARWSKSYGFISVSPADATNYLISGIYNQVPATSVRQFKFPKSGTLKEFSLNLVQTVNGSNETVTIYLRNLSTSTDYSIGTFTSDFGANAIASFIYTGLSISVNTTDLWAIKIACPTWVTNPTVWQGGGELLIK